VVVVTTEDGGRRRLPLPPGDASSWQVSAPVARTDVARVAITDAAGRTWCSASFD
jgi:hypothetical protein